jgi:DNA-binding CsgD family transcriptional regulator
MRDPASPQVPAVQRAILALSAIGESTEEIAAGLQLPTQEVRDHLVAAMGELRARSKPEAILAAHRLRLIVIPSALQCAMLRALAGGGTLVGTIGTLARSHRVGASDLRAGLRELLEVQLVAVYSDARGQLVVRLERRISLALPPLPLDIERRRHGPTIPPS